MSLRFDRRMSERDAIMLSPLQLAYLGDAVWEMIVRLDLIFEKLNVKHLHQKAVDHVNAAAQASYIQLLLPELSATECEIVQRGRNAHTRHPVPKNQHPDDYALATGFEALWGYLYITGQDHRITQLIQMIKEQEKEHG